MSTHKGKNYFIAFFIAVTIIVVIESFKSKDEKPPVVSKKGRNIIIGDSHGVGISFITKNAKAENGLAKSGWTLANVMNALKNKSIDNTVSRVFISIGTNGQFSTKDDVNGFVNMIKTKFPQANIYIYGGSYGWSGSLSKSALETRFDNYYKRFKDLGVYVMKSKLGYFTTDAGAHSVKSNQAKEIAQEIDQLSK